MCRLSRKSGIRIVGASFALLVVATAAQAAAIVASPLARVSRPGLQRVDGRCPPGYHEVGAMNGNGYRCVQDGH